MKKHLSFVALILSLALFSGCAAQTPPSQSDSSASDATVSDTVSEAPADDTTDAAGEASTNAILRVAYDVNGNEIVVPDTVDTIISLAPSTTQLLIDLGLSDKIVAVDTYSAADYGSDLPAGIPAFDMMNPDNEQIVALQADIVFTTGMSYAWGDDVFASAREAGVVIIDIESPSSLQEIVDSIIFIGDCAGVRKDAEVIAQEMDDFLSDVHTLMDTADIAERPSVLFALSTPSPDYPVIYSAGPGSYIDEVISLCGGDNIAADADTPWPALDEEYCVAANPDVFLTTDSYTPDAVNTLLSLTGWENVTAVRERQVCLIDGDRINRPNHHICGAILEIGEILFPELFDTLIDPFEEEALPNAA